MEPTQEVSTTTDGRAVASYEPADGETFVEGTAADRDLPASKAADRELPASSINALGENLLDASTFVPPSASGWRLTIEFCDRCRWLHRATWTATELSITFPAPSAPTDPAGLTAITLMPRNAPETAGRWRVWLYAPGSDEAKLVYDRKIAGGFGELKALKSQIRDIIAPNQSLGHSNVKTT